MKQEEWSQRLEQQLSGHEEQPSHDLWATIETRMAEQAATARHARRVVLWRRWAAAAAVAILVLGGAFVWERGGNKSGEPLVEKPSAMADIHSDEVPIGNPPAETPKLVTAHIVPKAETVHWQPTAEMREEPVQENREEPTATNLEERQDTHLQQESHKTAATPKDASPAQSASVTARPTLTTRLCRPHLTRLSLLASAGLGRYSNQNPVLMSGSRADAFAIPYQNDALSAEPIFLTGYKEKQRHEAPIEIGLTVSRQLTGKLSLSTGIVYSYLRSSFSTVSLDLQTESRQRLHYLGIPLNLQLQLWHDNRLWVYAAAGVRADWNLKASLTTNGVDQTIGRDRWQWSVGGSVGVEYDFLPRLGLYAEPGLRYYFDNGSNVINSYKEHPTYPSLQMGLRVRM